MHNLRFYKTSLDKLGLSPEVELFLNAKGITNIGQVLDIMAGKFEELPLDALSHDMLGEITDRVAEYEADYRSRLK